MKKLYLIIAIGLVPLISHGLPVEEVGGGGSGDITSVWDCASGACASMATAATDLLDLSASDSSTTSEGLILPQNAGACSGGTADGQICWDSTNDALYIGNGATLDTISGFSGDLSGNDLSDSSDNEVALTDGLNMQGNWFSVEAGGSINRDDNVYDYWGTGGDASLLYDGTNLILNPDRVGSGEFQVAGDLHSTGGLEVDGLSQFDDVTIHNVETTEEGDTAQTVDWSAGNVQVLDLDAAGGGVTVTFTAPTAVATKGASLWLKIIQDDAAGGYNITWPASVKWSGGAAAAPTISTGNSAIDVVSCMYLVATTTYYCTFAQDFQT